MNGQGNQRPSWLSHSNWKGIGVIATIVLGLIGLLLAYTSLGTWVRQSSSGTPAVPTTLHISASPPPLSSPTLMSGTPTSQPTPTVQPSTTAQPTPTTQPTLQPTPTQFSPQSPVVLCSALRSPSSAFAIFSGGFRGGSNNCDGYYSVANTPTQAQATWVFNFSPAQGTSMITFAAYIPANTDGARVDYVLYDCNGTKIFDDSNISQANGGTNEWRNLFTQPSLCVGKVVIWSGTFQTSKFYVDAFKIMMA